jgi:hypothetical protein
MAIVPAMMVIPRNLTFFDSAALFPVDLQLHLVLDKMPNALYYPLRRFLRSDKYVAIVGVTTKLQASAFQFLVQFVKYDITQQRA